MHDAWRVESKEEMFLFPWLYDIILFEAFLLTTKGTCMFVIRRKANVHVPKKEESRESGPAEKRREEKIRVVRGQGKSTRKYASHTYAKTHDMRRPSHLRCGWPTLTSRPSVLVSNYFHLILLYSSKHWHYYCIVYSLTSEVRVLT